MVWFVASACFVHVSTALTSVGCVQAGRLNVGYMTADYSNHPTAHMAEGLFQHHNRTRVAALALAIGKGKETWGAGCKAVRRRPVVA